jgi:hypothetical protein
MIDRAKEAIFILVSAITPPLIVAPSFFEKGLVAYP